MLKYSYRKFEASNAPTIQAHKPETKRHGKTWQAQQVAHALETEKHFEDFFKKLGLNY